MKWALVLPWLIAVVVIGAFDFLLGATLYDQARATHFATTTGTITHSATTLGHSKGPVHGVDIRYSYTVGGRSYQGDRYRYNGGQSSDGDWAQAAVHAYLEGAPAIVYYDPKHPADAVLSPGIDGSDLFFLIFLIPFNVFFGGFVIAPLLWLQKKQRQRDGVVDDPTAPGLVRWTEQGRATRVRLTRFSAPMLGAITLGGAAFLSIFPIGFLFGGFHPSMPVALGDLALILALSVFVTARESLRHRAGHYDLVIDPATRTIELPPTMLRRRRETVRLLDVADVGTEVQSRQVKGRVRNTYVVTLDLPVGCKPVIELDDQKQTDAFAACLRQRIKLAQGR